MAIDFQSIVLCKFLYHIFMTNEMKKDAISVRKVTIGEVLAELRGDRLFWCFYPQCFYFKLWAASQKLSLLQSVNRSG